MPVTDKDILKNYTEEHRVWQGIPGVACAGGYVFACFYTGMTTEAIGNYVLVKRSGDRGESWEGPVVGAFPDEGHRCYDAALWRDPQDRLWFIWSVMPDHAVWASVCDDPSADTPVWSAERKIGYDVMMNKPTVLSDGSWLFPMAVWAHSVYVLKDHATELEKTGPYVFRSTDNGATFTKLSAPEMDNRSFDEHMVTELNDGRILMLSRTHDGIAAAYSSDKGETWTHGEKYFMPGPDSRFHIRRLKSGRLLFVNHHNFNGRNNLTAFLSEDDGATWKYSLLLDGRNNVSYPDSDEADGFIYIIHDRERGGYLPSYEAARKCAREILVDRITEEDIIAGRIVNPDSALSLVVSKLTDYDGNGEELYR